MSSQNSLFRQQQHLYRSAHYLAKSKPPTLYTPPSHDGTLKDDTVLHTTKRNRMSIKKEFPISKLLATLDKDKLIELINDLVDSNPHLKSEVDAFIPPPTTQSISIVIANLEKKLNDSFPFGKTASRDNYSFDRVKPALLDVVNALIEYAEHFITSPHEHPTTIFSYLHFATCVANRLPVWDNDGKSIRDLYTELIQYWKKAIEMAASKLSQGKIYGQQAVTEWAKDLMQHDAETHGQFASVVQLFKQKLGWIIGID
ncbi:protein DBF8, partial [Rhizopus stolonifer]